MVGLEGPAGPPRPDGRDDETEWDDDERRAAAPRVRAIVRRYLLAEELGGSGVLAVVAAVVLAVAAPGHRRIPGRWVAAAGLLAALAQPHAGSVAHGGHAPRFVGHANALKDELTLLEALGFEAERERTQLYQITREGQVSNVYNLTIRNLDNRAHTYQLSVTGLETLSLDRTSIEVPAGETRTQIVTVLADPAELREPSQSITFILQSQQDNTIRSERETRFLGDVRR